MENITNTQFIVVARGVKDGEGRWGRSSNIRGALRDAGWRGGLNEMPPNVEAYINIQNANDKCSSERLAAGDFEEWEGLEGTPQDDRREILSPGDYAPPTIGAKGQDIIYKGELIQVW